VDVLRPRAVEKGSMWGDRAIPYVIDEPHLELDYPENVAAVEAALLGVRAGEVVERVPFRHPV